MRKKNHVEKVLGKGIQIILQQRLVLAANKPETIFFGNDFSNKLVDANKQSISNSNASIWRLMRLD